MQQGLRAKNSTKWDRLADCSSCGLAGLALLSEGLPELQDAYCILLKTSSKSPLAGPRLVRSRNFAMRKTPARHARPTKFSSSFNSLCNGSLGLSCISFHGCSADTELAAKSVLRS